MTIKEAYEVFYGETNKTEEEIINEIEQKAAVLSKANVEYKFKRRYRNLIKKNHSDKHIKDTPEMQRFYEENSKKINLAWDTIRNFLIKMKVSEVTKSEPKQEPKNTKPKTKEEMLEIKREYYKKLNQAIRLRQKVIIEKYERATDEYYRLLTWQTNLNRLHDAKIKYEKLDIILTNEMEEINNLYSKAINELKKPDYLDENLIEDYLRKIAADDYSKLADERIDVSLDYWYSVEQKMILNDIEAKENKIVNADYQQLLKRRIDNAYFIYSSLINLGLYSMIANEVLPKISSSKELYSKADILRVYNEVLKKHNTAIAKCNILYQSLEEAIKNTDPSDKLRISYIESCIKEMIEIAINIVEAEKVENMDKQVRNYYNMLSPAGFERMVNFIDEKYEAVYRRPLIRVTSDKTEEELILDSEAKVERLLDNVRNKVKVIYMSVEKELQVSTKGKQAEIRTYGNKTKVTTRRNATLEEKLRADKKAGEILKREQQKLAAERNAYDIEVAAMKKELIPKMYKYLLCYYMTVEKERNVTFTRLSLLYREYKLNSDNKEIRDKCYDALEQDYQSKQGRVNYNNETITNAKTALILEIEVLYQEFISRKTSLDPSVESLYQSRTNLPLEELIDLYNKLDTSFDNQFTEFKVR